LYTSTAFRNCHVETKYSGVPAGGVPASSRAFAGSSVKSSVGAAKSTTCTLGSPAYICCLLIAHTRGEIKVEPTPYPNVFADM
jgi:hypothetical protein